MNRVVYDSINESKLQNHQEENKTNANADKAPTQNESDNNLQNPLNLPTLDNCDNNAKFEQFYTPQSKTDYTLCFESRFESGNLRRAIQVYEFEYDLILKPDYNTKVNN